MSDFNKSDKKYVDDPMVHSEKMFTEGCLLENSAEFEKALSVFDKYRMLHPEDPKAYYELACCHYALQKYDQALEYVNRAITINVEYGEAVGLRGLIYLEKHEYEKSIPNLQFCNVVMPNEDMILFGLLQAYSELRLIASALICAKQLRVIKPLEIRYQVYEALLHQRMGQYDTAIELLEKVVANNPEETENIEMLNEIKGMKVEYDTCRYPGMNN